MWAYIIISKDRLIYTLKAVDFQHSIISPNKQFFNSISHNVKTINTQDT